MSDIKIHCSYCEQKLAVPLELVGSDIECPSCKNDIKVPIKEDSEKSSNKVSIRNKPGSEAIAKTNIPALTKGTRISKLNANAPLPHPNSNIDLPSKLGLLGNLGKKFFMLFC